MGCSCFSKRLPAQGSHRACRCTGSLGAPLPRPHHHPAPKGSAPGVITGAFLSKKPLNQTTCGFMSAV